MPEVETHPVDIAAMRASMDASFRTEKRDPAIVRDPDAKLAPPPEDQKPLEKPVVQPTQDHSPKGLRDALDQRTKRVKELEAKLAEFEPAVKERDTFKSDFDKLKIEHEATAKERDEFKKLQSVAALEQSPEFQKKYSEGATALSTRLQQLSEMAGIAHADMLAAVSKSGKDRYTALSEIMGDANPLLRDDLLATIREMDSLANQRHQELSQADELMRQRITDRESGDRRTREERAKVRESAWTEATKLGKEYGLTDDEISKGKEFFTSNRDAGKSATATVKMLAFDKVMAENAALKEEVAGYQGANPGLSAGARGGNHADADLDKMSLSQRMNELAKRAGVKG